MVIVGIGASAGGLQAFEAFFDNMPADSGLAFILVPHLGADYESHLSNLLQCHTAMDIFQVEDGQRVEPNRIYIIPEKSTFEDFSVVHDCPTLDPKKMLLNAQQLKYTVGQPELILLAIEDVTNE